MSQPKETHKFPSDYCSHEDKISDEQARQVCLAVLGEYTDSSRVEVTEQRKRELRDARRYYQGNQSNWRYFQDFGLKDDEAGNMVDYTDIDWSPVGFMTMFLKSVYSYLCKVRYDYEVRGYDEQSLEEKRRMYYRKNALMRDRAFFEAFIGRKITEEIPASPAELELMREESFKTLIEESIERHLQVVFQDNRLDLRLEKKAIPDFMVNSYVGWYVCYDGNGRVSVEHVPGDELIMPKSREMDFSDIRWIARRRFVNELQLRNMVRDRDFTEEEWEEILGASGSQDFGSSPGSTPRGPSTTSGDTTQHGETDTGFYGVIEVFMLRENYETIQKYRNAHNGTMQFRARPFGFEGEGVIEQPYVSVYQYAMVIGSDRVFNVGLVPNIVSKLYDVSRPSLPLLVTKASTEPIGLTKSLTEALKPIENMLQTTWNKLQNQINTAPPDIQWANYDWINNALKLGIQGNMQEALDSFYQTGRIVGAFSDGSWSPQAPSSAGPPAGIIPGGPGQAFAGYVSALQVGFMVMHRITGRTPLEVGQAVHPDTGKKVAELAQQGSAETLQDLVDAYELSIRNLSEHLLQMVVRYGDRRTEDEEFAYREVFGRLPSDLLRAAEGMNMRSHGIVLYKRHTEEELAEFLRDIKELRNERTTNGGVGGITEDEYMELQEIAKISVRKARRRLRMRRLQREQRDQEARIRAEQAKAQSQQEQIMLAAEVEVSKEERLSQVRMQEEAMKHQFKLAEIKAKYQGEALVEAQRAQHVSAQSAQDALEDERLQQLANAGGRGAAKSTDNVVSDKI